MQLHEDGASRPKRTIPSTNKVGRLETRPTRGGGPAPFNAGRASRLSVVTSEMTWGREHPWAKHYQHVWLERALDDSLPDWLRVAALAYGKHSANGHANLGPGELARTLASVNRETGEIRPNQNVNRAIANAVRHGWLVGGSKSRCLVVPSHAVTGGLGNAYKACLVHSLSDGY